MLKNDIPIYIIADDRECKSEVIQSLLQIEDVDVSIQRLSMGDYQIDNRLIVERKTLKDFAISIIDGRLFKQMIRLANSKSEGVLILEGTAGDIAESWNDQRGHAGGADYRFPDIGYTGSSFKRPI